MLLSITTAGSAVPLWQTVNGVPVPNPACAPNLPLNSVLTFNFGGAVDPTSLPSGGQAIGSINITAVQNPGGAGATTVAALGNFSVVDDPTLPAMSASGGSRRSCPATPPTPRPPV